MVKHAYSTPHHIDGVFYNREPQARASHLAGASFVYAVKSFEKMGEMLLFHAFAVVVEGEAVFPVILSY